MPRDVHDVDLYFDFVSPYAYLALTQVEEFGERHGVRWNLQPVVYGVLLDATGLVGPVEVPAKRQYTLRDITRTAAVLGVPLAGPPAHPFRSLEALRCVCAFLDRPEALRLTVALSAACWGDGGDLTDLAVIEEVVRQVGLDDQGLAQRIGAAPVKETLREITATALPAGVFGVPTFAYRGELFWGHDRMLQLAARLAGSLPADDGLAVQMESRPRGADRAAAPSRRGPADAE